ncbi:MAG: DinB family protein [Ignavibacteria bacterium]|nr:DinB family protein [Ignavibacteria bacterium]
MNSEAIKKIFNSLKLRDGVAQKLISLFPDDKLNWKPSNEVRTVQEIVAHIYGGARASVKAIQTGTLTKEESDKFESSSASTNTELLKLCKESFDSIYEVAMNSTDEVLRKTTNIFYGDFTVGDVLEFFPVEHSHHYGQLTVYARILGITPPFAYDFE